MAFSRGGVNHSAAAGGNAHLLAALKKITQDLDELKTRTGAQAVDFDKHTPVGKLPGLAGVDVRPLNGRFTVVVTNPEYIASTTGSPRARNPFRAPVLHRLAFSTNAQFDGQGDIRSYGPSTQTHWSIDDIGVSLRWVRLESSFDGENWNKRTVSGPFQS